MVFHDKKTQILQKFFLVYFGLQPTKKRSTELVHNNMARSFPSYNNNKNNHKRKNTNVRSKKQMHKVKHLLVQC
jgi:hypothetical protein